MAAITLSIILDAYDKMSGPINKAVTSAQNKLSSFAQKSDYLANKAYHSGKEFTAAGFAVAAPLYKAFEAASDFETKMIDIRKQMSEDTPASVKKMTDEVFKLSKQLPLATDEIQDMIASGLRMGVPQARIVDYTTDVAKMAAAFDMSAGEISDSMAGIAGIYKIPIQEVGDLADAINYLDDNTITKGPQLINVLQRIGGTTSNMNPKAAAALASTMLSLKETPEVAGTAINGMVIQLSNATMQGKKFQQGLDMIEMSAEKVKAGMVTDPKGTILQVFESINEKVPKAQRLEVLTRLFNKGPASHLQKLSENLDMFKNQLKLVGQDSEKLKGYQGSMDKEFKKRMEGSAAQTQIFKNRINQLWVTIGNSLLPVVNKLVAKVSVWIDKVGVFITKHPKLVSWILKAALAFSALAFVGGYLSFVVSGVARLFNIAAVGARFLLNPLQMLTMGKWKLLRAVVSVKNAFKAWRTVAVGALNAIRAGSLTNPVFLAIAGIALAAFLLYKYWSPIKAFFIKLWNGIKRIFTPIISFIWTFIKYFTPIGWIIQLWKPLVRYFSAIWGLIKALFKLAVTIIAAWLYFLSTPVRWLIKLFMALPSFFKWLWNLVPAPIKNFVKVLFGIFRGIIKFIFGIGKQLFQAGKNIVTSIIDGITSVIHKITDVINNITKKIRSFLPFSPAKEGALKDIHRIRLIETITEGVDKTKDLLPEKVQHIFRKTRNAMIQPAGSGLALQGISPGGGGTRGGDFNLTINLSGGATQNDAKRIATIVRDELKRKERVSFA